MSGDKTTSKHLPKISLELLTSIQARYLNRTTSGGTEYGAFLNEVKQRMIEEDPVLTTFIEAQLSMYSPEHQQDMFKVVMGLYGLLEAQAESNFMTDSP